MEVTVSNKRRKIKLTSPKKCSLAGKSSEPISFSSWLALAPIVHGINLHTTQISSSWIRIMPRILIPNGQYVDPRH